MQKNLNIATIQMVSKSNWKVNLEIAAKLVQEASNNGAQMVVLPEFFICITNTQDIEFKNIIEPLGHGIIQDCLAKIARDNKIYLVAGTIPIEANTINKYYNTSIVYNDKGEQICHYHKIHLFKFNNGEHIFDEEAQIERGKEVITFEIEGFTCGLAICYDLRFPELFRKIAGVNMIILPAAFVYYTGQAHWEILLRARAIENQCYVIASGQGGIHDNGRHTFGHSMIIDPWGTVNGVLADGEGIIYGIVDKDIITRVRSQLPALANRQL